jgi:hypothetical protein
MEAASRLRHEQEFSQEKVLGEYENLLLSYAQVSEERTREYSAPLLEET